MFQICTDQYQKIVEGSRAKSADEDDSEKSALLKIRQKLNLYKEKIVYKPVLIMIGLFIFQQLSCAYVIIFYAVDIFRRIGGDLQNSLNAYVALVLLGTIRFIMSIISVISSKRIGRRPTMFFSATGMCITVLGAGYFFDSENKTSNNLVSYLILGYISFSSVGYFVIPWTLIGEILPMKVRGKLGGFMISIAYIFMFGMVKSFPFIFETIDLNYIFYSLSAINFCGLLFLIYFLPETLGKSFSEIEKYFNKT